MRISDWSSDVCSSDLRKPEDEAEHDRCDRADQRPGLGRARPEQAEQEDDRDPRRDEAREFLDILERLIETAKQRAGRSEEHTSELQSLMRNSNAVFCLKKKTNRI